MEYVREPARDVPVVAAADVVVLGGGPSGICAAVAAARNGASVLLIEKGGFLGGNAAMWLPLLSYLDRQGRHIIRGIAQEIIDRLKARGAVTGHYRCALHESYTIIDPEAFKVVSQEMVLQAGVSILLHTFAAGVLGAGGAIAAVLVDSKSGRAAVKGKVYIDCTGDGDIAAWAGAPFEKGDANGQLQPPTLMFTMRGVDVDGMRRSIAGQPERYPMQDIPPEQLAAAEHFIIVGLQNVTAEARARGDWDLPNDRVILISTTKNDEIAVNMTRVPGTDGSVAESLTSGEITARAQMDRVAAFLVKYVPGFERALVAASAHQIGIRETRRIMSDYVLTGEDVVKAARFDDEVLLAGYMVDIHHAHDGGVTLAHSVGAYGIPYRCLLPRAVDNLLVAGRSISATREAQGAVRVMPPCMAMGEAAGCAAAMAAAAGVTPRRVDVQGLRSRLRSQGACLEI
jgi:hypothetical protein